MEDYKKPFTFKDKIKKSVGMKVRQKYEQIPLLSEEEARCHISPPLKHKVLTIPKHQKILIVELSTIRYTIVLYCLLCVLSIKL